MSPSEKRTPDGSAGTIPPTIANLFNSAYMPYGIDPKDPRISPLLADADNFPASILIVTAGKDSLAVEAEELAKKLESHGKDVTLRRAENMDHAWDKDAKENTPESKERDAAYDLVIKFLLNLHN
jgi:acetyl esterase/lipase